MSGRFRQFRNGDRLLFVGARSSFPYFDERSTLTDASRIQRALQTFVDTERELAGLVSLVETYNQASSFNRGRADNIRALTNMAVAGRLVVMEVQDLRNEPDLDVATAQSVANMDLAAKMTRVAEYMLPYIQTHVDDEVWKKVEGALNPLTIGITLAMLVAAFMSGVGAAIVIGIGWAMLGWSVFNFVRDFAGIVVDLNDAETDAQLHRCAEKLGSAIIQFGIEAIIALLTRGAGRFARNRHMGRAQGRSSGSGSGASQSTTPRTQQRRQQRRSEEPEQPTPRRQRSAMDPDGRLGRNADGEATLDGRRISQATNNQKGNFGEAMADQDAAARGWTKVNDGGRNTQIGDPIRRGIDGVYTNPSPPPDYIVADAKYGSSRLGTLRDGTRQMSDRWIEDRLEDAVGDPDLADDIIGNYERVIQRIDSSGNVTLEWL